MKKIFVVLLLLAACFSPVFANGGTEKNGSVSNVLPRVPSV